MFDKSKLSGFVYSNHTSAFYIDKYDDKLFNEMLGEVEICYMYIYM